MIKKYDEMLDTLDMLRQQCVSYALKLEGWDRDLEELNRAIRNARATLVEQYGRAVIFFEKIEKST